jgi:hypothetical protein
MLGSIKRFRYKTLKFFNSFMNFIINFTSDFYDLETCFG